MKTGEEEWQWLDDIGCIEFDNRYIRIVDIGMTTRLDNVLRRQLGAKTLGDIVQYASVDLLRTSNFGRRSLDELISILKEYGLKLSETSILDNTSDGKHIEWK